MDDDLTIPAGIEALEARFGLPEMPAASQPVFLFAAGWRSGSTLVQRMLVSDGSLLMWGEPYDHSRLIPALADSLRPFGEPWPPGRPRGGWPPDGYLLDPSDPPGSDRWIANAYPRPSDLLWAHREFLDRLFARPAAEAGYRRWGIKEVRLDGEHAVYLQTIYPDARFVFLHRNPWDAWLSYRRRHDERPSAYWWFHSWPDEAVSMAGHFGAIWRRLTESFLDWAPIVGAEVLAYEDVVRGEGLDTLEALTGVRIRPSVLQSRIGGSAADRSQEARIGAEDASAIGETAGPAARRLGYVGPTEA